MYTIKELLAGYGSKEFSPVEVTRQYVEQTKKTEHLNAFITVTEEIAMKQAEIAEKRWLMGEAGPLEGIPLSYKDNYHTKNVLSTSGSKVDKDFVPKKHAVLVEASNQAGAVMIGKTNMHEFAFGITNNNPFYGPARNPWNPDYIPGGSSGGSAVSVLANSSVASLGTDTGGSIRIPASCCGLVGLKPTKGLLSTEGVTPISPNLDQTGPITRTVDDLIIIMNALLQQSAQENKYPLTDWKGIRVGVPTNYFNEQIEAEVAQAFEKTLAQLEELGAVLVEVEVPHTDKALGLTFTLATSDAGYTHKERIAAQSLDAYGDDVRHVLESSQGINAVDYIEAIEWQREISRAFDQLMEKIDIFVAPTLPALPKPIGQETVTINDKEEPIFNCMIRYTSYFNLTGHPALSVPVALSGDQLPIGVQFVGKKLNESFLMELAKVYEEKFLHDFYKKREQVNPS